MAYAPNVLGVVLTLLLLFLSYRRFLFRRSLNKIPGPAPDSFLTGNFPKMFGMYSLPFHEELLQYGGVAKLNGFLFDKMLYFTDPLALHHIIVKDQYTFEETQVFLRGNKMMFGESLFTTVGAAHAKQRRFLNPVFSIAHMRTLLPIFQSVSNQFRDIISSLLSSSTGQTELDMYDWCSRAALEFIGQAGLGYSFDAFDDNSKNDYRDSMKAFLPTAARLGLWRVIIPPVSEFGPAWMRRWVLDRIPNEHVQRMKRLSDIMDETSRKIWMEKKSAHQAGTETELVGGGKDIMSLMLLESNKTSESRLSEKELIGQMTALIFAGHDTTSSGIARTLHLLAHRQDWQERVRKELGEAQEKSGNLSYDELMGLPYLDAICRETLRLFAPVNHMARSCLADTVVPLSIPITSTTGELIHEVLVPKGTSVWVGLGNANKSREMWGQDAMVWNPERWMKEGEGAAKGVGEGERMLPGVYSGMMTFLGGGRACIGFKFSLLELKVVLSMLLANFKFTPSDKDADIQWAIAGITKPYLKGGDILNPVLLLNVEKTEQQE